jgi:hypothetical protein
MYKKIIYVLTFLLFFGLGFGVANAEYFGGKWQQKVVYYGKNSNLDSTYTTPMNNGLKTWNGIDSNISYKNFMDVGISQPVDVWLSTYTNQLGYTAAEWAAGGYYGFGVPSPDDSKAPYTWGNIYIIRANTDPLGSTDKTRVIMHEGGHVLGLAHTTKWFTSSVMDKDDVFGLDNPTSYDKTNIQDLY